MIYPHDNNSVARKQAYRALRLHLHQAGISNPHLPTGAVGKASRGKDSAGFQHALRAEAGIEWDQFWDGWEVGRIEGMIASGLDFPWAAAHAGVERRCREAIESAQGQEIAKTAILSFRIDSRHRLTCESADPKIAEILANIDGGAA